MNSEKTPPASPKESAGSSRHDTKNEQADAYAAGLYDAELTLDSNPLVIPKPKKQKKKVGIANGDYLDKWLRLKDEIPPLFRTEGDVVVKSRPLERFVAKFPEAGGYQIIFDNSGRKPKENPNPLNALLPSGPLYERCLVSDCGERRDNMWAFCVPQSPSKDNPHPSPPRHWHLDEGKLVKMTKLDHVADWIGTLNVVGTSFSIPAADFAGISELLVSWAGKDEKKRGVADKFVTDILFTIVGEVKDSTTIQLEAERNNKEHQALVNRLNQVVEDDFEGIGDFVTWERQENLIRRIPIKVAAQLMAIGFAAEEANRGDFWFRKHVLGQSDEDTKRASAYMSATYFTLRMNTLATPSQARMSLRA